MSYFRVCLLSDLSDTKPKKFEIDGIELLFVKSILQSDKVWAFDNNCNHADKPLENGRWNAEKAEITCPFHKAIFSIKDGGEVKSPPACVPLSVYETEIREENSFQVVFVKLD